MSRSLIYRNIYLYRMFLNLLYTGEYTGRFRIISRFLDAQHSVVDLCFGDTYIAEYCRQNKVEWLGYDMNDSFVQHALDLGYNAKQADIIQLEKIPACDVCIMQGSLYHFYDKLDFIFNLVFASTDRFIISEPIKNLSSRPGILGKIARISANAGKGNEQFRFTEKTFRSMLDDYKMKFKYDYRILYKKRDMIVEITLKNNK